MLEVLKKVVSLPAATKTGNHSFFMQQLSTAQYICLAEKHLLSHANVPFQPWTATTLQKSYLFITEINITTVGFSFSSYFSNYFLQTIDVPFRPHSFETAQRRRTINASSLHMLNLFILIQCVPQAFKLAVDLTIVKLKWFHSLRVDSALCCRYLKILHRFEWYWSNDLK